MCVFCLHSLIISHARARTALLGNLKTFWPMNEVRNDGFFSGALGWRNCSIWGPFDMQLCPRVEGWKRWVFKALLVIVEHAEGCWCDDATGRQWLLLHLYLFINSWFCQESQQLRIHLFIGRHCWLWNWQLFPHSSSLPKEPTFYFYSPKF